MPFQILIVNPNSTAAMTAALEPLISSLHFHHLEISYFTAPPPAPPSINDPATSRLSAEICLPFLTALLPTYDAILIACYSEHPLVAQLRSELSRLNLTDKKFIIGIFESSVVHALALVDSTFVHNSEDSASAPKPNRWGIVTTGKIWEGLLTTGVELMLGVDMSLGVVGMGRFAGVVSTGLNASELHQVPKEELDRRMKDAVGKLLRKDGEDGGGKVTTVCLGCAGMVGLEETVRRVSLEVGYREGEVIVVDGVKAGVLVLEGLLKGGYGK